MSIETPQKQPSPIHPHPDPRELEQKPIPEFANLWTLYYRQGSHTFVTKNFYQPGSLKKVQERARLHCQIMGLTFVFVRPMLTDLETEEKQKMGVEGSGGSAVKESALVPKTLEAGRL